MTVASTASGRRTGTSRDAAALAGIDFHKPKAGTDEVFDYSTLLHACARDLASEVQATAEYIRLAIRRTTQGRRLDSVQAGWTAKQSTRALFDAAASLDDASRQARKFQIDYANMYAELIRPDGRQWEFKSSDGH